MKTTRALFLALSLAAPALPVGAQSIGMVTTEDDDVLVFDADTDTPLGTVSLPLGSLQFHSDCVVLSDLSLGFVANFTDTVFVIDLLGGAPALAAGVNAIPISNPGEDLVLSNDERFLIACDGSAVAPISVIDVTTRTEVHTASFFTDCNSVEVCDDGSVLVTSYTDQMLGRLIMDAAGQLSLASSASLLGQSPQNLACAPGGNAVVVLHRDSTFRSFQVPDLNIVSLVSTPNPFARTVSASFNADGTLLFVRTEVEVLVYPFDPDTGGVGALLYTIATGNVSNNLCYGVEQMALHPDGSRLYVPEPGRLAVYDPANGALLDSIPLASPATEPLGVCVSRGVNRVVVDFDDALGHRPPFTEGTPVRTDALITARYYELGVVFDAPGGGLFAAASINPVSPPNAVGATQPGPLISYSDPATASFWKGDGPAVVDAVQVSLTDTSSPSTLSAFALDGTLLGTANGAAAAVLRVEAADAIHGVRIDQGPMAFDDFTFEGLQAVAGFALSPPLPGRAAEMNELRVTGGPPGELVMLVVELEDRSPGALFSSRTRSLHLAPIDGAGRAEVSFFVPAHAAGLPLRARAYAASGSSTRPVRDVIAPELGGGTRPLARHGASAAAPPR